MLKHNLYATGFAIDLRDKSIGRIASILCTILINKNKGIGKIFLFNINSLKVNPKLLKKKY